jgi:hypothetical protein
MPWGEGPRKKTDLVEVGFFAGVLVLGRALVLVDLARLAMGECSSVESAAMLAGRRPGG